MRKTEKDTPKKILEAALHLVARDGYANVSMRDIAREAGVSISQISYYYNNKEGLVSALVKELKETVINEFCAGLERVTDAGGFADYLCAYAKESVSHNAELHRLRIELSNLAMNSGAFRAEIRAVDRELTEILASRLEACEPPLAIASPSPRRAADFIIAVIFGVAAQYLVRGGEEKTLEALDVLRETLRRRVE
ncbi:TetR/AcrR family transcriptional regulator [Cloacibacillus sp. An23]|uniref:TetR/AcrR family transcriptional regulator n=1 Tax=Cloacibacillus sp. An23 TaxID=1965591 RepID=UPI000B380561|nr:TetR/AcrR family transcriptional regulator [Cloacibacillus sp. An23]